MTMKCTTEMRRIISVTESGIKLFGENVSDFVTPIIVEDINICHHVM